MRSVASLILLAILLLSRAHNTFQACSRPSVGDNVVITPDKDSYSDWEAVTISCEDGSSPGLTYSYCSTIVSDWDPDPSTAECAAPCSAPNVDDSVTVTPEQSSYSKDDTVTFSCESGTLTGSSSGICGDNSTWIIQTTPGCSAGCEAPSNTNGTGEYDHGGTAVFSCIDGYQLTTSEDTIETSCDDGSWSPDVVCEFSGCSAPEVNVNVTIEGDDGTYGVNSRVTLSCADTTSPIGPLYSYCNSTGGWEPDPLLLTCYNQCEVPSFSDSRLVHSSLSTGESGLTYYDHTDTMVFSCGGLYVEGPWRATCKDGAWSVDISGDSPVCKNNCTAPSNTLIEGSVFVHGHVEEVIDCVNDEGIVRLGGPGAFCNDGTWKPNVQCRYKTEL
ncbi:complement component receptor 1-like protein [Diadema setosum]|uniref:complement component receptor 1-like protein n=1 Tax=Diadema setosum TaxID=31175 RepID=UPI003B3B451D